MTDSDKKRFFAFVIKGKNEDDCWGWSGAKMDTGRGVFSIKHKIILAPRASWLLFKGEIPRGLNVLHKCDNPECSNPGHLFIGTQKDNIDDCIKKGRFNNKNFPKGEKHCKSKLTEKQVLEIRDRLSKGEDKKEIAKTYNVTPCNIDFIDKRITWKNI